MLDDRLRTESWQWTNHLGRITAGQYSMDTRYLFGSAVVRLRQPAGCKSSTKCGPVHPADFLLPSNLVWAETPRRRSPENRGGKTTLKTLLLPESLLQGMQLTTSG